MTELLQDGQVTRYLDHWSDPPYTADKSAAWVTAITAASDAIAWAIEAVEDGAYIGNTGLDAINLVDRRCSWGLWIAPPDRWGRGYGTEACRLAVGHALGALRLHKVTLEVYAGNERARRAYERAGFVVEGTRRRHHWDGERLIDVTEMAVFADSALRDASRSGLHSPL